MSAAYFGVVHGSKREIVSAKYILCCVGLQTDCLMSEGVPFNFLSLRLSIEKTSSRVRDYFDFLVRAGPLLNFFTVVFFFF